MAGKPLTGFRIVSLAQNIPGPAAVARLRDLGASVMKIEPPDGDPLAMLCPAWYRDLSEGIQVIRRDLKNPDYRREMDSILETADLFLSSIRPCALSHLSLTRSDLHDRFPRLCQIALVGYPPPHENRAGHDLLYGASLGLLAHPHLPRTLLVDLAGAERVVSGALSLLLARERGDEAGYHEISLYECAEVYTDPCRYGLTNPQGILGGGSPRYNIYKAKDGWIAVAALENHFWESLLLHLGLSGQDAGYQELSEVFLTRTTEEWKEFAGLHDLPIAALRHIHRSPHPV